MNQVLHLQLRSAADPVTLTGTLYEGGQFITPTRVVPALGARSIGGVYDDVMLVGDTARYPPRGWETLVLADNLRLRDLFVEAGNGAETEAKARMADAQLASGLVLEIAEQLRSELARIDRIDVVFETDFAVATDVPPPWLALTARRLRWRGRLLLAGTPGGGVSAGALINDADLRAERGQAMWDRPCPVTIASTTYVLSLNQPSSWTAIRQGMPIPVRASTFFPVDQDTAGSRGALLSWKRDPPLADAPIPAQDFLEQLGVHLGRRAIAPVLFIYRATVNSGAKYDRLRCEGVQAATLGNDVMSTVNPVNGATEVVEVDRFGRVTLAHLDDDERPLACTVDAPGGRHRYVRALDLGNVLFPGIDRCLPVELARIGYNGRSPDVMPRDIEGDDLHIEPPAERTRWENAVLRPLENALIVKKHFESLSYRPDERAQMSADPGGLLKTRLLERLPPDMPDFRSIVARRVPFDRLARRSDNGPETEGR